MSRIIISVVGKNDVGMAANICTYLAENNINILDITQTIVKEIFDMMMVVDIANVPKSFDEIAQRDG
ncbi:MAG: ACT domain-containing protein [Enterocloster sp.]